ncbi:MAG: class I SAM-dependent methyltransferase, partial [Gammaproteobacteria bacterium]|nr:class I SAM-dependent methyltransferase [Gammaproteobacteria bacterium]
GQDYLTTLEFLQFGDDKFEYALREDPEFLDRILSGREAEWEELWFRATNTDPLQNVHGIMGAVAIDKLFDSGDILEIGGGTGNGIRNLFSHLSDKNELDRVRQYIFTDISQKFIMSTRREIRADYPDVDTEWRFVDLNVPINQQKIGDGSIDLIYAVNAAHVAKDIIAFLRSCRKTLRPGGRVLFAERIRLTEKDMAPRELALNLSIYHRTAALRNDKHRPMHCYLSPKNWLNVLDQAGYGNAEIWPDLDALNDYFPDQYAAVITAVA